MLLVLLPVGAVAIGPTLTAKDCVMPLVAPVRNEDGTPLTDFDHFLVFFATTPAASESEGAQVVRVPGARHDVRCPPRVRNKPGQYYVRATAVDVHGRTSLPSPLVPFMVVK